MKFAVFLVFFLASGLAKATGVPHPYVGEAERRYLTGDYEGATRFLLAVPGVAQVAPALTSMGNDDRARLFFDLGCCYFAAGDSTLADEAFKEAFSLNDRLQHGFFQNADPGTFWWALLRNKEAARRMKTRRLFAAMRSLVFPGWGQFYRGHTRKGYAFMGAAIVTMGVMGLQYRDYRHARRVYEETNLNQHLPLRYANDDGTRYTEWETRYRKVKSGAKRVNVMLGVIGAVWLLNMTDSAVFGPAPMGMTVSF